MKAMILFSFLFLTQTVYSSENNCEIHPTLTRDLGNVKDYYMTFASDQEASTFYAMLDKEMIAGLLGRAAVTPIDLSDNRYIELKMLISDVKDAYDKVYPALQVLPTPKLVLLPVKQVNAAAVPASPLSNNLLPNLFFINEGMLDSLASLDKKMRTQALVGLIAHELAHMYFRHGDKSILKQITQAYIQNPKQEESLGFIEAYKNQDSKLTTMVTDYQVLNIKLGPLSGKEYGGIPFGNGVRSAILGTIMQQPSTNRYCKRAKITAQSWLNHAQLISEPISLRGEIVQPTHLQKLKAKVLSIILIAQGKKCYEGQDLSFYDSISTFLGITKEQAAANFVNSDLETRYLTHNNNMTAIVDLFKAFEADKMEIENKLDLKNTRIFTKEEEADDITMLIESALDAKYANTAKGGNIESLFRSVGDVTKACEMSLQSDTTPNYGLIDDHHSICYRIFHARKLKSYFAQCNQIN